MNTCSSIQTCSQRGRPRQSRCSVDSDSSELLPIDEYNVGPVLEKLLAMMQSMTMLLSALKNDLRHSNMPEVVAKKQDAATSQLWRAFVAYHKSFSEIEQFAALSKTCGRTARKSQDEPVHLSLTSSVKRGVPVKTTRRSECLQVRESDVIELSESESDDDVKCKRPRCDPTETDELSTATPVSSDAVELTISSSVAASSSDSSLANVPVVVSSDVSASESDVLQPLCHVESDGNY